MSSQMLKSLIAEVKSLEKVELQISAFGKYSDKRNTKVQDVAHYQNDGTKTIKASNFVERSAKQHNYWTNQLQRAVGKWFSGDKHELSKVGGLMAKHINEKVDRIRTSRLRYSFRHYIKRS